MPRELINLWRVAAVSLVALQVVVCGAWYMREELVRREQELELAEWETQRRSWSERFDEQDLLMERMDDSQESFMRQIRELRRENEGLKKEIAGLRAATRAADEGDGGR